MFICVPTAFVYFGLLPVDSESPEAKLLIPYALGVLDALEIKNGATHCEVMMTADGPCLVVSFFHVRMQRVFLITSQGVLELY